MRVEIYSDVVCPWCYIGKRRFDRALSVFEGADQVEVIYRPFQLDPAAPATAAPLIQRLQARFGSRTGAMIQRVSEAALNEGIEMRFDRAQAANTVSAHRLLQLAATEYGLAAQRDLVERLFEAHFVEGTDIGDHRELVELAAHAGLDRERAAVWLASDEGLAELRAELRSARERGISAVPTFIFDEKYSIEGGQPAPVFLQALGMMAGAEATP